MQPTRRLAAILFTDIVGSTSMMQKDEQHAVSINKRYVAVLKENVLSKGGEILNDFGDGSLCTFRRLAAILFTDIVGSTSMMQKDEQHAVSVMHNMKT